MPRVLSRQELKEELKTLEGWQTKGRFIVRPYEFKEFMEGIKFVNNVAGIAERLEHHPDISIRYTLVTLSLQTHSEGGVTKRDVQLAKEINELDNQIK
jgi:4a-hydroxytetrahydrobiopterin dehydratase